MDNHCSRIGPVLFVSHQGIVILDELKIVNRVGEDPVASKTVVIIVAPVILGPISDCGSIRS